MSEVLPKFEITEDQWGVLTGNGDLKDGKVLGPLGNIIEFLEVRDLQQFRAVNKCFERISHAKIFELKINDLLKNHFIKEFDREAVSEIKGIGDVNEKHFKAMELFRRFYERYPLIKSDVLMQDFDDVHNLYSKLLEVFQILEEYENCDEEVKENLRKIVKGLDIGLSIGIPIGFLISALVIFGIVAIQIAIYKKIINKSIFIKFLVIYPIVAFIFIINFITIFKNNPQSLQRKKMIILSSILAVLQNIFVITHLTIGFFIFYPKIKNTFLKISVIALPIILSYVPGLILNFAERKKFSRTRDQEFLLYQNVNRYQNV